MEDCKSCRFWEPPQSSKATWGRCKHIVTGPLVDIYFDSSDECFEHVSGEIIVESLPEFGCVLWETIE